MRIPRINQRVFSTENLDPRLRAGLVGHWIGGGSGNTWFDRSGYGNHGALTGDPVWTLGEGGKRNAVQLDGVNDYVNVGNSIAGLNGSKVTVSVWVKSSSIGANQYIFDGSTNGSFGLGLSIRIMPTGAIRFWNYDASNNVTSTGVLSANTWYHVIGTWDGTTSRVYINGVADGTNTGDANILGSTYRIGHSAVLGGPFNGSIDDVRIYNRALSAAEVSLLATPSFSPVVSRRFFFGKRSGAAPPPTTSGNFFVMFR